MQQIPQTDLVRETENLGRYYGSSIGERRKTCNSPFSDLHLFSKTLFYILNFL